MNGRLYRYCRTITLAWLALFCMVVLICVRGTGWDPLSAHTPHPAGEALPIEVAPVPKKSQPGAQKKKPAQPAAPAAPAAPPTPPAGLSPLAIGGRAGHGVLGRPEFSGTERMQEIRIPCTGTPGEYRTFRPDEVAGRSFDFNGQWKAPYVKSQHLDMPGSPGYPVKLFQMAQHEGFARLSLVFHAGYAHTAEVFAGGDHILIRLTAAQPGGTSSPAQAGRGDADAAGGAAAGRDR